MKFKCSAFDQPLEIPDEMANREGRCYHCGAAITVPSPDKHETAQTQPLESRIADNATHVMDSLAGFFKGDTNGQKYPALRAIAFAYRLLAILIGLIGTLAFIQARIHAVADDEPEASTGILVAIAFGTTVGVLTVLAVAEIIGVFLDIECRTTTSRNSPPA